MFATRGMRLDHRLDQANPTVDLYQNEDPTVDLYQNREPTIGSDHPTI